MEKNSARFETVWTQEADLASRTYYDISANSAGQRAPIQQPNFCR